MQLTDATGNIIYTDYRLKITIGKGKNSGKFVPIIKNPLRKIKNPLRKIKNPLRKIRKIRSKKIRKILLKTHLLPIIKWI